MNLEERRAMGWQYDSNLSKVEWAIGYLGIATIKGRFTKVQANLNLDAPDPSKWSVQASIEVASLSTGFDQLDDHVRSGDFLDVEHYLVMTFQSTRVEPRNDHYVLVGDLMLRGVTLEIVLDASYGGEATDTRGRSKRGFSASTNLKRSDFGIPAMAYGKPLVVGEEVQVTIEVVAGQVE